MVIQSIVLTPTLPSQDQEKAPVSVQRACRAKRQLTHKKKKKMQAKYEGVIVYTSCNFSLPPSLSFQTASCHVSHLSPTGGLCPPLHHVPHRFPAEGSARAAVAAGERPPSAPPRLFGGEPARQVSAQNKHSWLSYEPPEG